MDSSGIFLTIGIILAAGFIVGTVFRRLRQSTIVAYLVGGVIIGPNGLALICSAEQMNILSDIGIILLMFILGMSFPPKRIADLGGRSLVAALLQIGFTTAATAGFCCWLGLPLLLGLLIGGLVALSSTAIVIKILIDHAFIDTLHGRLIVSCLIIQDLAAILLIAIMPNLSAGAQMSLLPTLLPFAKGIMFLAVFYYLNRRFIPRLQYWVVSQGNKELFLIGTLVFCLGVAVLSHSFGLSFALGAFLAGLIVSDSDFNYQILAGMTPFRDAFLCIFFVALGMLLDPMFVIYHAGQVAFLFLALIVLKFVLAGAAMLASGYTVRIAFLVGAGLAQIGEFSFVILKMGLDQKLVTSDQYNLFLSSSLLTMIVTPYLLSGVPAILNALSKIKIVERCLYGNGDPELTDLEPSMAGHVVICGYGPIGRTIGRALMEKDIPFVVLELNARTVATMRKLDVKCFYGDASSPDILRKVHADTARIVVVTPQDRFNGELVLKNVKHMNPECFVLMRSHFSREVEDYYDFGADAVVQEEFEAGLSMLSKTLGELNVPGAAINREVETLRIERDDLTRVKYFGALNFSSNISAARIVMDLKAKTKEMAIRELVEVASQSAKVKDKEEFNKRVLEREEISTTGIGDGIAIPHARTEAVDDVVVTLGISRKGIEYGAIDEKPVHLVILFGVNKASHELYLKTLGSVASVFQDTEFKKEVIQCTDVNRIIRLIQEREKKIGK